MGTTILSIFIVSGLAAGLAAILVIAQRFIADYGECEITINDDRTFTTSGGKSLLESLKEEKVFIPSACGGRGTCAYCKVQVPKGGGPLVPIEEPYLTPDEIQDGVRLSCQVKVRNNVRIQVPDELFAIREYSCRCTRIVDLTHDIKEFQIKLDDPPELAYVPGQYIQLVCPPYNGNEEVFRAYSIASDPEQDGSINLVIRLVPGGICTTWCFEHLKEGDELRMNGPYGEFRLSENDSPMVFIAGGTGMAPMKSILHHMRNTGNQRPVTYFFGVNSTEELFYGDLMKDFETQLSNVSFVPVVARPQPGSEWGGETGLVTEALERHGADISGHEAYLCGSPGMIDASMAVLQKIGVTEDRIFFDKF